MPKYLIERTVPGAHEMSPEELREAATKSCGALAELGTDIQWQQSYVSEDRITCVYIARDPDLVREHARRSGFPADAIHEVAAIFDPATAETRRSAASLRGGR